MSHYGTEYCMLFKNQVHLSPIPTGIRKMEVVLTTLREKKKHSVKYWFQYWSIYYSTWFYWSHCQYSVRHIISLTNVTKINIIPFIDYGVLKRHNQVDSILGALEIEKESFQKAQLFSWVFFPIWILLALVQLVCFVLSNGRFHPLTTILEACNGGEEGKCESNYFV